MQRITKLDLERALARAADKKGWNITTGWIKNSDGKLKATIGYTHLNELFGGSVELARMDTEGGGISVIHHASNKREMLAYLRGAAS